MTLRLVRDDERAAIPCRIVEGHGPAVILVSVNGQPYLPACDSCARWFYDRQPDTTRMAPLAGYVDMYEAAKQAAQATPEQVAGTVQVTADTIVDNEVLRHTWRNQVIYCRIRWCEEAGRLTPTDQRLNAIGGLWYPACAECAGKVDQNQTEVVPIGEHDKDRYWEMVGKCARDQHWVKPGPPMSRRAKILWGAIPSAVLAAGITMTSIAAYLNQHMSLLTSSATMQDYSNLKSWGIALIVISALALAGVFLTWMISVSNRLPAGTFRVPRQPVMASQQAASGSWSIPVGDLALWGAWGAAEYARHRRHERAMAYNQANAAYWQNIQDRQAQRRWMDEVVGSSDWQQPMAKALDYLPSKRPHR